MHAKALEASVQNSETERHDVTQGIHSHGDYHKEASRERGEKTSKRHAWLEKLVPCFESLSVKYHAGNYVALRDPTKAPGTEKFYESMPVYARYVYCCHHTSTSHSS